MKKRIQSAILILSCCSIVFAEYRLPIRTLTIPYAPIPFIIDGNDNEVFWSKEQSTDVFNPTGCSGDDADFTFTFKIAWDENYLYLFGKILDDINNSWEWGFQNQWTFDNVEVFFDLDTNGSGIDDAYDSNTYAIRINRGIDSVGNDFGRMCKRSDHKYYWKNTSDGWIFEAALAWKFVLGPNQKPEDIMEYVDGTVRSGFDIFGSDSDTPGPDHRDCQTAWDNDDPYEPCDRAEGCDNYEWNNRSIFGIVNFQPKYITAINEYHATYDAVYPNPTTGILNFDNLLNNNKIEIINLAGEIVLTAEIKNSQLDISNLPKGLYIAKFAENKFKILKE